MFDVLIREASARFNLGNKAQPLLQMLLARMFDQGTGGLKGFLDLFINTGAAPQVQSWLGGGAGAQPLKDSQVENALGAAGGLLSTLTERLDVSRDSVTSAIGYLLPPIIGKLTAGSGTLPAQIPDDVQPLVSEGQNLLNAPLPSSTGGLLRWLPLALLGLVLALGLVFCSRGGGNSGKPAPAATPPASVAPAAAPDAQPASAPAPDASAQEGEGKDAAASTAADAKDGDKADDKADSNNAGKADDKADDKAGDSDAAKDDGKADDKASDKAADAGASAEASDDSDGNPVLRLSFADGQAALPASFADLAAKLKAWLDGHTGASALISAFTPAAGDADAAAKLARQRAANVRDALVALGVPADRLVLAKPAAGADDAQARRVDVGVRFDDRLEAGDANGRPMLRVFFGSGKSAVPEGFATHAAALKSWLDEHEGAKLAISGFNDPTGNAAANAELAKNRAENVRDALVAAGIAAERMSLEKPQDATDDDVSLAEARRVEVKVSE